MTTVGSGIDGSVLPEPAEWLFGGFGLFGTLLPVIVGLVLLGVYVRSRVPRVPLTTAPAAWAAGRAPSTVGAPPIGQWNARVTPRGYREQDGESGVVRLENGWFGFHVAGVATPTWIVPVTHLRAGLHSVFSQAEVWIDSEQTGRLNLTVSHEPIMVPIGNDLRNAGQRRHADELLWLLHQAGATIDPA
ncbi:hypothetical protein N798_07950 [Knoellia flava TL1]|uniref:DUF2550 domain-containing protein n=2 Tax=Knoellia flava TaxID=913969 RepID=A0A8H9KPK6_9MICO|nr:hypothetical protein [Knoellia flava]KGN32037.1 hypothetical protein N798_07950 [Knoellia flava TL1]GGB65722.1 hypothetical protein GCM10011314_01130 [Knoellia flava]